MNNLDITKLSKAISKSHYTDRSFFALFGGKRRAMSNGSFIGRASKILRVSIESLTKTEDIEVTE